MEIRTHTTEARVRKPVRVAWMADPKSGKTRAATSLPWGDFWGEQAIYVAADTGADDFDASPILEHNKEHLICVTPTPKIITGKDKVERLVYDPHKEAFAIASRNWKKEFPAVGTLIWDTMTRTGQELLAAYTNAGVFVGEKGDKHVSVGDLGQPDYLANPMQGDYGMAQNATMQLLNFLFKQPLNIIVLFHTEYWQPEGAGQIVFGPATVGKAIIKPVASLFDNLFWSEAAERTVKGSNPPVRRTKFILHTAKQGYYLGGLRSSYPTNPIPQLEMDPDPVNVWRILESVWNHTYEVKETK